MSHAPINSVDTPPRQAVNLAQMLTQTARRNPTGLAVRHGETRWTWHDLDTRASAFAAELIRRGVQPGQCVMLDGPNSPEFIQAMYGAWRAGAAIAPVNSRLHANDISQLAELCQPAVMIAHSSTASHAEAAAEAVPFEQHTMWLDGVSEDSVGSYVEPAEPVADQRVWRGDHAWYFFTSGTSGRSKASVLTHDQMGFVITNHLADLMPSTDVTHRSLVVAPLSHGAGIHLLPQVARGAATVIPESASLDPAEVWKLVGTEKVTNIFVVPTILKRLVEDPSVHQHDHSTLQYVIYAGAPMPSPDIKLARDALGDVLVQYYGLGEVTGNITVLPPHHHDHPFPPDVPFSTCGYPRTGMQISIQDDDGNEVPALHTGEICVAGPAVFSGYLNNPDANAQSFRDGWFRTGDIGMLDGSGFLFITGRVSDMYISGGSNIHPREIEEKILNHPAVKETLVLGMPDPDWGEIGVAVCVLEAGCSLGEEELREWLKERMARYKVPRRVVFWEGLPRSGYGKIVRRTIRNMLQNQEAQPIG
ncbi:AMP-binding protein [Nesterenkonia muleiensis]|uniref:AMP-binding protein n=1 Tax=Nesterenkonia muleiensis TaxID=2282648 RepID=UPI000E75A33A|nr:AMP-binding protein [Nesterenkonia muleiensis]